MAVKITYYGVSGFSPNSQMAFLNMLLQYKYLWQTYCVEGFESGIKIVHFFLWQLS